MLRNTTTAVLLLIALSLSLWSAYHISTNRLASSSNTGTTAYDRVMERGTLRVGYIVTSPYIFKDSAKGTLSGPFYDLTEELGKSLSLKVEWVEEVNLTNMSTGLETGRYDMVATPLWRNGARARAVGFSIPLFYSTVGAYVRADDNRFDGRLDKLNAPDIHIAAIDGEMSGEIAKTDFPKALVDAKPALTDYSQILLEVASGKADVTFYDQLLADRYLTQNPGTLRKLSGDPIRIFADCFILPKDEYAFNEMINASLTELVENGALDRALVKAGEDPTQYYRRAHPFRSPTQ
jgi:polar amino acid transport system substrate-binding protein